MTEEHKVEEHHAEHKAENQESESMGLNLSIFGNNNKEISENLSYLIIIISAILLSIGIGLGSFIQGTILLSVFGSFFIMIGIIVYIASQFIEA